MRADPQTLAKALDWVNSEFRFHPKVERHRIIEQAAQKFDLGPLDEEWLIRQVLDQRDANPGR